MSNPVIHVQNLKKSYGRKQVLRGVSLDVRRGELVGISGENGVGKSTLLKCLVGLLGYDQGSISIIGSMGYCPQEAVLFELLTMAEHLQLFGTAYGMSKKQIARRTDELLVLFGCKLYSDTVVAELSGGTRQKLNLIIALLNDPDVLVLDEPYQGFDYETYLTFWEYAATLRERGKAIVVVSHIITEHGRFNTLFELKEGQVWARK